MAFSPRFSRHTILLQDYSFCICNFPVSLCFASRADPEAKAQDDFTPLHFAAQAGSVEACEALIAKKVNMDPRLKKNHRTPLMLAAGKNHREVVLSCLFGPRTYY